jgi:hypothetical protein
MSGQTSTNWHVRFWTGSQDPRSQMTVKSSAWSVRNATASQESPSESWQSQTRTCLIKAVDNLIFRPLVWIVAR